MKYLQIIITIFVYILFSLTNTSASFNKNDIVEIYIENIDGKALQEITKIGASIDNVKNKTARVYLLKSQLVKINNLGYKYSIKTPSKSNSAGYHSYSELTEVLQNIESENPELCKLYDIGESYQKRKLWFMKISDNVDVEEDEPEFKYISTMHGDEPVGTELCINFIKLLMEQYGKKDDITKLVNEIEIWIMPLMNPDGYENGQRYNMQGHDLNRSFPDRINDPNNTIQGRPTEVQRVMEWGFNHFPVLSANFHTGALVANYPYDTNENEINHVYTASPDDELFKELSLTYSFNNKDMYNSDEFEAGITNGTHWYIAHGTMQDWNYVWRGCLEVTIELNDEKWPDFSKISTLWDRNVTSMKKYMEWTLKGVRGIIRDSLTGEPVDAVLNIDGIDHSFFTDPDVGDYHRVLLLGNYQMEISAEGYQSKQVSFEVFEGDAIRKDIDLIMNVPLIDKDDFYNNLSQIEDKSLYYKVEVPSDASYLSITTHGGTGDCDLYVRYGDLPTDDLYNDSSLSFENYEYIEIDNPESGDWYIRLKAFELFENVTLQINYDQYCINKLSSKKAKFTSMGGTGSITVTTNSKCPWLASTNNEWITITTQSLAEGFFEYSVLANIYPNERSGSITVENEALYIYQEKNEEAYTPCKFELAETEFYLENSEITKNLTLTTYPHCTWEIDNANDWISIISANTGTGSGTISYSVSANNGQYERTGNLFIADIQLQITQKGQLGIVSLSNGVSITNINHSEDQRYYKIYIPPNATNFMVMTDGGTGDCDLYLNHDQIPTDNNYFEESTGYDNYEVIELEDPLDGNWYIDLTSFSYFSNVTLTAAYNTKSCTCTITPEVLNFSSSESMESITVETEPDCFWRASSFDSWIDIIGNDYGRGSQELDIKVLKNNGLEYRSGSVNILDKSLIVNQKGMSNILNTDVEYTSLFGNLSGQVYYKFHVPPDQDLLELKLWGGEGSCTLYASYGQEPTSEIYDEKMMNNDSTPIYITNPEEGGWYLMLYGNSQYSGISMKASTKICEYSVSQKVFEFNSSETEGSLSITTNYNQCLWNVLNTSSWISINSYTSGAGTSVIDFLVHENPYYFKRSGIIQITNNNITINQKNKEMLIEDIITMLKILVGIETNNIEEYDLNLDGILDMKDVVSFIQLISAP